MNPRSCCNKSSSVLKFVLSVICSKQCFMSSMNTAVIVIINGILVFKLNSMFSAFLCLKILCKNLRNRRSWSGARNVLKLMLLICGNSFSNSVLHLLLAVIISPVSDTTRYAVGACWKNVECWCAIVLFAVLFIDSSSLRNSSSATRNSSF